MEVERETGIMLTVSRFEFISIDTPENHVIYANLYSIHNKIHMTPNEIVPKQINWIESFALYVSSLSSERCWSATHEIGL